MTSKVWRTERNFMATLNFEENSLKI